MDAGREGRHVERAVVQVVGRDSRVGWERLPRPIQVQTDIVAPHGVAHRVGAPDAHPRVTVGGDEIALVSRRPADEVVRCTIVNIHTVAGVTDGGRAAGVRADIVAAHHIPRRGIALDDYPVTVVARDEIVLDRVSGRVIDLYAGIFSHHAIAQGAAAAGIGADIVAPHHVPHRTAVVAVDADTDPVVARYDVAFTGRRPANDVVRCAAADQYAIPAVPHSVGAVDVRADIVAADGVAHRAATVKAHATPAVAADEVTFARTCPAWCIVVSADEIVRCTVVNRHASVGIAEGGRPADVGANMVTVDDVVCGIVAGDVNAIVAVAADEIALSHWPGANASVAADGIMSAIVHFDAVFGKVDDLQTADRVAIGPNGQAVAPLRCVIMRQSKRDGHRVVRKRVGKGVLRPTRRPPSQIPMDVIYLVIRVQDPQIDTGSAVFVPQTDLDGTTPGRRDPNTATGLERIVKERIAGVAGVVNCPTVGLVDISGPYEGKRRRLVVRGVEYACRRLPPIPGPPVAHPGVKAAIGQQVRPAIQRQTDVVEILRLRPCADAAAVQNHPGVAAVNRQVALGDVRQCAGERDGYRAAWGKDVGVESDRVAGTRDGQDLAKCACAAVSGIGHDQCPGTLCFGSHSVDIRRAKVSTRLHHVGQRPAVARIHDNVERIRPNAARHERNQPGKDAAGRHVCGQGICDRRGEGHAAGIGEIDRIDQIPAGLHRVGVGPLGHDQPCLSPGLDLVRAQVGGFALGTRVAVYVVLHARVHALVNGERAGRQVIAVGGESRCAGEGIVHSKVGHRSAGVSAVVVP